MDLCTRDAMKSLFTYMDTFWLKTVGPTRFSVLTEPYRKNNSVESWHRSLNRKLVTKHLGILSFLSMIRLNSSVKFIILNTVFCYACSP